MGLMRHVNVLRESLKAARDVERVERANDNTAFLPAALEVLETPPNPLGRIVLWVIMAFLSLALAWACFGQIDVVAVAQGRVIPDGRIKTIQAPDSGVVRAVYVHDGQRVAEGDPLIEMDPTVSAAELERAHEALLVAQIDRARAGALLDHANGRRAAVEWPAGLDDATRATQDAIVSARIAEHSARRVGLAQERSQRAADRAMVAADIERIEQQLPLAEQQLQSYRDLEARGFAPRLRVAEVEERTIGMRQDRVIRGAELRRAAAAEGAAATQLASLDAQFRREALDAFNEADATARLRQEESNIAAEQNRRTLLRAPAAGIVQQLQVHTVGAVVRPADALLVIVPEGSTLVVDAMVLNRDVGFVREGQPVRVKLEAFPFTRYGVVEGRLTFLSRDAVQDEELGLVFPARVELQQFSINVGGRATPLSAGLAATAEIRTGRRRIIEFLLSPLQRRVEEAGRER
ncbi:HlyD family type I secretion periplasmic adaptor subunit [Terricaulis silvestris]|uniref:Membrane fusion protein (MFP) family protein n=1 Tax=Terricaulis silvestris TaxID=2686094 RepID=A0A6I6MZR1_9CAUL|nr:HlyD family type I secretion periplasmic adaptor subunit [Terricaulis silvestris]QGZ96603.1 Hemolysin secretion protein D, chromosomal [Terricaulis silvestris]